MDETSKRCQRLKSQYFHPPSSANVVGNSYSTSRRKELVAVRIPEQGDTFWEHICDHAITKSSANAEEKSKKQAGWVISEVVVVVVVIVERQCYFLYWVTSDSSYLAPPP